MSHVTCQGGGAPNGGLIVPASPVTVVHREQIVALAARHRLPAGYPCRYFSANGGLASYGAELLDLYRRARRRMSMAS